MGQTAAVVARRQGGGRRLPVVIQRIETDHGSEFGTDFTWHLHDVGIAHRYIPRGNPESNGKVERSHRTDEEACSRRVRFRTLEELQAWMALAMTSFPVPLSPSIRTITSVRAT